MNYEIIWKKERNILLLRWKLYTRKHDKCRKKKNDKGIKILGSGCAKCKELEKATRSALTELNLDFEIEHITDFAQIASYGVMSTPALVFNGKVISYGKVLTVDEVKKLLEKER